MLLFSEYIKKENAPTLEAVPDQRRRLFVTLILKARGINWFNLNVSYFSNFSEEPCIIDSRCRLVEQGKDDTNSSASSKTKTINNKIIPTLIQCMTIGSSLGRKSCLKVIEISKKKPLGLVETKNKLLESAYLYDEDPINSIVRNLYGTILQYRCPFGQRFSTNQLNHAGSPSNTTQKNTMTDTYNITCSWNQTWGPLYHSGTSLPNCLGMLCFRL